MGANGQPLERNPGTALRFGGRVLVADDLRELNGHSELILTPGAIISPLAADELRARGIRVSRQGGHDSPSPARTTARAWGYAIDRPNSVVESAISSAKREGVQLSDLAVQQPDGVVESPTAPWARAVADCVVRGECGGGISFCNDAGLVCCVANKLSGVRAVSVTTVDQAARAVLSLVPNLVIVEVPGRSFFEIRQILRRVCRNEQPPCPPGVACVLQELDGHAHR